MADSKIDPAETNEEPGAPEDAEGQQEQEQETPAEGTKEEPEEGGDEEEIPTEVLQKELTRARQEAAKYRTSLRDAEKRLSEAKTQEDIDSAVASLQTTVTDLERNLAVANAARTYKIPDDYLEFIKGESEDEINESAKKLAALTSRVEDGDDIDDLRGGLNPSRRRTDSGASPRELADRYIPRGRH